MLYGNGQAREVVKQFRKLCYGKSTPIMELFAKSFERTKNATKMEFYSDLLNKAIRSIKGEEESKAVQMMFDFGGFNIPEHYKTDVKLALRDFIPKDLKTDDKKRIKDAVKEMRLMYQIAGEEIPSVINDEYRCQVSQFYVIDL